MVKICCVSDLHGYLPEIPECNILIVAGDVCPMGTHRIDYQRKWITTTFAEWVKNAPADNTVWIGGNHDFALDNDNMLVDELAFNYHVMNIGHYLQDSGVSLNGINIWGTPWIPNLEGWAFYGPDDFLEDRFSLIPNDTDILVSHGPPYLYGDKSHKGYTHCGAPQLNNAINRVLPDYVICGHIHEARGAYQENGVWIYNVSTLNRQYQPYEASPVIIEYEPVIVDDMDSSPSNN